MTRLELKTDHYLILSDARSFELMDVYQELRKTHASDDDAAACTLQKLTEEEGRRLWALSKSGAPPKDWMDETHSKPCPVCGTLLPQ